MNMRTMHADDNQPILKDKKYVARYFGVSIQTVDRWIIHGGGPRYMKIGSLVRYSLEDLAAFADSRAHGGQLTAAPAANRQLVTA
jgi:predicted DNA-binding transcriptional regulator AlpA